MTISRYLMWEVVKPLAIILGVLTALFASYCAAGILSDAVNGLLPVDTIAEIAGLKVLISLEVLIPISLFISVVLAFGRLYGDSEMTAMFALCVAPARVMGAVFTVSAYLAIAVAALSLFTRPWAYQRLHELSQRGQAILNLGAMEAGVFYIGENGGRVIYIGERAGPRAPARDVFIRLTYSDHTEVIHAALADKPRDAPTGAGADVDLHDAHIYEIGDGNDGNDQIVNAADLIVDPNARPAGPGRYNTAATGSLELAGSDAAPNVAEWQWRLSTPVSTLLLGMLGLPLGRVQPRQSRYARFGTAILIYGAYYLLCMSARTWVQQGAVGRFPGLWWAPALLGLTLFVTIYRPRLPMKLLQRGT